MFCHVAIQIKELCIPTRIFYMGQWDPKCKEDSLHPRGPGPRRFEMEFPSFHDGPESKQVYMDSEENEVSRRGPGNTSSLLEG